MSKRAVFIMKNAFIIVIMDVQVVVDHDENNLIKLIADCLSSIVTF